jgi:glycosyltransferase involved in cell wall biosynthesis
VRRVLSYHGYPSDVKNKLALRLIGSRMHARISVSAASLRVLGKLWYSGGGHNWRVLQNGVDHSKMYSFRRVLREELAISEEGLLAGMVGNFTFKDQLTVCRALPVVFQKMPSLHFAFIGSWLGKDRRLYDACVQFCVDSGIHDRVHFVGKRIDVADVLQSLDLFVLSSREETFGIAVIEAMMVGVPALISDIPPFVELAGGGKWAHLFKTGDERDLAAKMLFLLQHPEELNTLATSAKQRALSEYAIEKHITDLKELYSSLCAA